MLCGNTDARAQKYGYYATNNRYFFCYDPALMETIFGRIRNNGQYSEACGPYKIKNIRDLTTGSPPLID